MGKIMFISIQNRIIILLIVFTLLPIVVLKIIAFSKVGTDKKFKQHNNIKEIGYISERTVQEQIRKRMMKSFGSVEELDRLVTEFAKQKKDAEAMAATIRVQDKEISKAYNELKDTKSKYETENLRLQKKIRNLEELLPERKTK